MAPRTNKEKYVSLLLLSALMIVVVAILVLSSVPPVSRDALTHHLAIPKLYLKHGGIYEIPGILFSYYPMNLDLLYTIPLFFQNDIAPKYIHFLFALLTALFIYKFLRENLGKPYDLLGALFFLTIPIVVKLSITVYVDLGLIFFSWMCLYFILKWFSHNHRIKYLLFSAVFCGLALGTKYNALVLLPIMGVLIAFFYSVTQNSALKRNETTKKNRNSLFGLMHGGIFIIVALIVFSPWMIRNYHWKKNPIYPLYNNWFVTQKHDKIGPIKTESANSPFKMRREVYHESFMESILIPVRIFFQGRDDDPKYFDGKLNPFLIILPFLALWKRKKRGLFLTDVNKKILFSFSFLFILFILFQADMRIRYIAPAIPPLVVLSMFGMSRLFEATSSFSPKVSGILIPVVITLLFFGNANYILQQFKYVQPGSYLLNKISRDDYISRYRGEYPVVQYANQSLPADAKVLCLLLGHRTYHVDRDLWLYRGLFFNPGENENFTDKTLLGRLNTRSTSHIIFGAETYEIWAKFALKTYEKEAVKQFFKKNTRLLYQKHGYQLLEIKSSDPITVQ